MVDNRQPRFVIHRRQLLFGDRHADSHRKSLSERTGGRFHPYCHAVFRVAWRQRFPLAEFFQFVQRQAVAEGMQHRIKQRRTMTGRKDEPVAVDPGRLGRVMFHETVPQYISHRRRTERQARVA